MSVSASEGGGGGGGGGGGEGDCATDLCPCPARLPPHGDQGPRPDLRRCPSSRAVEQACGGGAPRRVATPTWPVEQRPIPPSPATVNSRAACGSSSLSFSRLGGGCPQQEWAASFFLLPTEKRGPTHGRTANLGTRTRAGGGPLLLFPVPPPPPPPPPATVRAVGHARPPLPPCSWQMGRHARSSAAAAAPLPRSPHLPGGLCALPGRGGDGIPSPHTTRPPRDRAPKRHTGPVAFFTGSGPVWPSSPAERR